MDTEVKDPKELTVFAAFMTPQAPTEETLSTGDSGAPKRRRSAEETGTGPSSSDPGLYLTNPSASARQPKRKGKGKGKGGGKQKGRQPLPPRGDWTSSSSEWGQTWQPHGRQNQGDLLHQLSRLVLRHELQLQNVQSDTKIHLYLRTGAHSFLPSLFSIAREWGRLYRDEPQKLGLSLRETLLIALLKEMATRAKLVLNKEAAKQSAVDMGWLTPEGRWAFMQWNPQTAQLDLLETPQPRDHEEILRDIDRMVELVNGDSVKRFSSAKTLVAASGGVGGVHTRVEHPRSRASALESHPSAQPVLYPPPPGGEIPPRQTGLLGPCGDHQTVDGLNAEASDVLQVPLALSPPVRSFTEPGSDLASVSCPCEMPSACQVLLRAVLLNHDATACYMNASALALLWSIHFTARPQLGRLAPLFQQLKAGSAVLLTRSMVWTMILGPWAQPNRQHDMHELLVHLVPRLQLPAVRGEWQFRRLEAAGVAICEQASTVYPITLDVPEEARGLQHCIQAWHSRDLGSDLEGPLSRMCRP